ncbi:MAP kinase kinase kinase wis4 [Mizuhopecten yessoensis]|uniref:MAP kinase kinase kinase wis4 n=1 Tax=Mizuhopecten yessoensis TaxID=6573 RepID=A0A210PKH9_MIZYE|nr:MAP kinase kinase kinase wis4 [Mizuhopecten yessoensis]
MNTMATTMDGTSMQPGTPSYQAPEVLLGRKGGTTKSDIWSVGCTISELFTEVPTWNVPLEVEPVMYVISCMKDGRQPDSMKLFASKFANICSMMLNMALDYNVHKRPSALEMLTKVQKAHGKF